VEKLEFSIERKVNAISSIGIFENEEITKLIDQINTENKKVATFGLGGPDQKKINGWDTDIGKLKNNEEKGLTTEKNALENELKNLTLDLSGVWDEVGLDTNVYKNLINPPEPEKSEEQKKEEEKEAILTLINRTLGSMEDQYSYQNSPIKRSNWPFNTLSGFDEWKEGLNEKIEAKNYTEVEEGLRYKIKTCDNDVVIEYLKEILKLIEEIKP
jgi:uncharacterized protein (UPF0335 family)